MTATQLREILYTTLTAAYPTMTWQQAGMSKPATEPWGVLTYDGEAPPSVNDQYRAYIYYKVWIYKNGDEAELVQKAADIKRLINGVELTASGKVAVFDWISTGRVFRDDLLMSDGIDITFRCLASSI